MNMLKHVLVIAVLLVSLLPFPTWAQQAAGSSIGTVTALQGQATVGRVAVPQPTSLKFRDDVFFRDQITTKAQSTVRLLLGGKGVLTIREQSQVTLDESVAPTGERQSVLSLLGGKIAAAIARSLMRPGEEVEIRTPNAVAAVRGTVLIAEYIPAQTSARAPQPILLASSDPTFQVAQAATPTTGQSNFLVLTGSVTVTAQGAPPVTVGAMQTVSISVGPTGGAQVGPVQAATQAQVAQATQGFQMGKSIVGDSDGGKVAQTQAEVATTIAQAITQATSGTTTTAPAPPAPVTQPVSTPVVVPVTPTPAAPVMTNDLPAGPLLQVNSLTMTIPTGMPVMNFSPGEANTIVPVTTTGTGMDTTVVALTSPTLITGNTITHAGPLLGLNSAAMVAPDPVTPIVQISGTTFTATATGGTGVLAAVGTGALAAVDNGSFLQTYGNLLTVIGGTLNVSGTALSISGHSGVYAGGVLFNIQGQSTVNTSGGPLVQITDGELIAGDFGTSDGTGNHITIGGGLLDATDANVVLTGQSNNNDQGDKTVMAQPAGVPQIRLTRSSLTMPEGLAATGHTSSVVDFGGGTSTFDGLLLIATDNSQIYVSGNLLGINSGTVSTTEASRALIQLTNTDLINMGGTVGYDLLYVGGSANLSMAGPFLSMSGGNVNTSGSLLHLDGSAMLKATTTQPLFQFTNVTFDISTNSSYSPAVFALSGGAKLALAGPLMSMSGGTIDANGPLLRLDSGLLDAANATIIQVTGGRVTSNKNDTSGGIYLYNSQITAQQMANLNNSQIQITNGPLLNVSGGSQMTISGDLATLANGARITVSNGPLIAVDGATSKLAVNGALANFVGSGNQVIITNSLIPDNMYATIPVQTGGGGTITFGPGSTFIKGAGGTMTVNGVTVGGGGPYNGSVIKSTNGGTVVIKGN